MLFFFHHFQVAGEIKILDNMTVSQPTKPVRERKDSLTLDSKDEKSGKSAKKAKVLLSKFVIFMFH